MSLVIKTQGLSRSYETYQKSEGFRGSLRSFFKRQTIQKLALKPTDLEIGSGQIIGLVGANGAGKTTLLKLLSGLIQPTVGRAEILGYDPSQRKNEYLRQVSILLGQKAQLWWDLAPVDSFSLLTEIYELDREASKKRWIELSERLDCREQLQTQLRRLSLGERMKMEIIGSLLHQPKVLFLDEPTIGLDIVAQGQIREFLSEYRTQFRPTILLTSHYMDDISSLADRLLLMSRGEIVYDGTISTFLESSRLKQKLKIQLSSPLSCQLSLSTGEVFQENSVLLELEITQGELGARVTEILQHAKIEDLSIHETDFEEIIHEFLQKNSSLGSARCPQPV